MLLFKLFAVLALALRPCIGTIFDDLNTVNSNIEQTSNDADTVTDQSPLDELISIVIGLFGIYDPKGYGKALDTDLTDVVSTLQTADANQDAVTATAQCLDSSDNGTPSTSFIVAYTTTFNEITPMANKVGDAADRVAAYPYCAHIKDSLSGLNLAINKSYNDIKTKCYGSVNSTPCCAAGSAPDPPGCSITSCSATPDLDTAWKASMAAVNAAIGKYDLICKIPSV